MSDVIVAATRTGAESTRTAGMYQWEKEGANEWMGDARCAEVHVNVFIPDQGSDVQPAKDICAPCPVREQCLLVAVERREGYGVWGGTTPHQRAKMHDRIDDLRINAGVERARNRLRTARAEGAA